MIVNHYNRRRCLDPVRLCGILLGLFVCFTVPVRSADGHEIEILIPIETYKLAEGLALVGPPLGEIEVRLQGSQLALKDLSLSQLKYRLDLSNVTIGVESIPIDPGMIQLPEGVNIIRVNPAYLTLSIDRRLAKKVPVKVSVSGQPADSFFVDALLAKPPEIVLCGPETVVGSVDEVLTKAIDVSGRSQSFKKEIALDLAQSVEPCSSSAVIAAEVHLAKKIVTRRFADILLEGKNTPFEFSITPSALTIDIKGPQNVIANLQPQSDIRVFVELQDLKPGVYVRRASISLPVETTLVNVEPELFTVKIIDPTQ